MRSSRIAGLVTPISVTRCYYFSSIQLTMNTDRGTKCKPLLDEHIKSTNRFRSTVKWPGVVVKILSTRLGL